MAKDSVARIELGRSFHQKGIFKVKVCESDFVPLLGVAQSCLSRLQLVQNSAARFLTKTRKRESITPVWLVCIGSPLNIESNSRYYYLFTSPSQAWHQTIYLIFFPTITPIGL